MKKTALFLLAAGVLVFTSLPVSAQQATNVQQVQKEKPKVQQTKPANATAQPGVAKTNDGNPGTAPAVKQPVTEKIGPMTITSTPGTAAPAAANQAAPVAAAPAPPVPLTCTWDVTDYDFGKNVIQMKPASATFAITNAGKDPVTITLVQPSCGCTSPKYTKEPIKPGEKGEVVLTYDAKNSGYFSKSAQVKLNDGQKYMLTIKGDVQKVEEPAVAPATVPVIK